MKKANVHLKEQNHNGMDDWQFILIDKAENVEQVRRKKACSQYKICTFAPDWINKRNVTYW